MKRIFIAYELVALIAICKLCASVSLWNRERLQALEDARNSENVTDAVQGLLSVICDAQVWLGADGRMLEPSPQLAHLLAQRASPSTLEGRLMEEFVDAMDQARFQQFARDLEPGPRAARTPATTIHVALHDASTGTKLPVQLFRVSLATKGARTQLLGIRLAMKTSEGELVTHPVIPVSTRPVELGQEMNRYL